MPEQRIKAATRKELRRLGRVLEGIVTNDSFISAAVEAHNDPTSRATLEANPKVFFEDRRQPIPDDVAVEVVDGTPPSLRLSTETDKARALIELSSLVERFDAPRGGIADFKRSIRRDRRGVASDPMLDVMGETIGNDAARERFNADPNASLKARGLRVSDGVKVTMSSKGNPLNCGCWLSCSFKGCSFSCGCVWSLPGMEFFYFDNLVYRLKAEWPPGLTTRGSMRGGRHLGETASCSRRDGS